MMTRSLQLPAGEFKAYLFDLDGTLADSMPLHFVSWTRAVEEHGGTFPEKVFYELGGVPLPRTVELLNERYGTRMPIAETVRRKEQLYLEMLPQLKPVEMVLEHVVARHGEIPLGIVSGSPRLSIERTLTQLGLLDRFAVVISAEDTMRGKPHPDPFLAAAERLGVAGKDCLVFEDADAGITAAEAAGMAWVRVPVNTRAVYEAMSGKA